MRYPSTLLLFFLLMLCNFHFAKATETSMVIRANEHTTVALFFPAKIVKVIQPAAHFKFGYVLNEVTATLSATEGMPSNLTVITDDGLIYSFELRYAEKIDTFTWMLKSEQAIGKTSSSLNTALTTTDTVLNENTSRNQESTEKHTTSYVAESKETAKSGMKSI